MRSERRRNVGQAIHRLGSGADARYRVWSTYIDGYATEPLTRDEMRECLLEWEAEDARTRVERSLEGADGPRATNGDPLNRDADTKWAPELCATCFTRHHDADRYDDNNKIVRKCTRKKLG